MDKPKRKHGDQSWLGRIVDKHISFCTTTPLEECVQRLKAQSQKASMGTYVYHKTYIPISVKQIDADHYSFEMKKATGGFPYAALHGTLERMGEETLVRATSTMIGSNVIMLLWGWIAMIGFTIFADNPIRILAPVLTTGIVLFYFGMFWFARDDLIDELVLIVGRSVKYK
jgi:hypothetical protein